MRFIYDIVVALRNFLLVYRAPGIKSITVISENNHLGKIYLAWLGQSYFYLSDNNVKLARASLLNLRSPLDIFK